mgnify:CR=1 FL=1
MTKFGGFGGLNGERIKDKVLKGEPLKLSKCDELPEEQFNPNPIAETAKYSEVFDAQHKLDLLKKNLSPSTEEKIIQRIDHQMSQEDYEEDMDIMRELNKNKKVAISSERGDQNTEANRFKNPLIESQETRKMELSLDPSFAGSVQRFREEEADTFGNGSTKHSLASFGN